MPLAIAPTAAFPFPLARRAGRTRFCWMAAKSASLTGGLHASYLVFAHIVEDRPLQLPDDLAEIDAIQPWERAITANELGDLVAEYALRYDDGTRRPSRFGGDSPFSRRASFGARAPSPRCRIRRTRSSRSASENIDLGRIPAVHTGGARRAMAAGATRRASISGSTPCPTRAGQGDQRDSPGRQKRARADLWHQRDASRSASAASLDAAQAGAGAAGGLKFNAIGELDGVDIDLGTVISARAQLDYDRDAWFGEATNAQPARSETEGAIIEYRGASAGEALSGPKMARWLAYDLSQADGEALVEVAEARQLVRVKVVDERGARWRYASIFTASMANICRRAAITGG